MATDLLLAGENVLDVRDVAFLVPGKLLLDDVQVADVRVHADAVAARVLARLVAMALTGLLAALSAFDDRSVGQLHAATLVAVRGAPRPEDESRKEHGVQEDGVDQGGARAGLEEGLPVLDLDGQLEEVADADEQLVVEATVDARLTLVDRDEQVVGIRGPDVGEVELVDRAQIGEEVRKVGGLDRRRLELEPLVRGPNDVRQVRDILDQLLLAHVFGDPPSRARLSEATGIDVDEIARERREFVVRIQRQPGRALLLPGESLGLPNLLVAKQLFHVGALHRAATLGRGRLGAVSGGGLCRTSGRVGLPTRRCGDGPPLIWHGTSRRVVVMGPDRAADDAADRLRLIEQARTIAAMDIWIQNGGPPPAARSRDFGEAVNAQAAIEAEIDRRVGFRADGTPVPAPRDIDRVPEHHQAVTLYEWTFYPEHDNREDSSSSAYRAARKKLVAKGTCLVCGVGKDTLAVPDKNPV